MVLIKTSAHINRLFLLNVHTWRLFRASRCIVQELIVVQFVHCLEPTDARVCCSTVPGAQRALRQIPLALDTTVDSQ